MKINFSPYPFRQGDAGAGGGLDLASLGFTGDPISLLAQAVQEWKQKLYGDVAGVMQLMQSRKESKEAKSINANNPRPFYDIPVPVRENVQLAERDASKGLSDASRIVYENEANKQFTTSIDAILRGGGGANDFASLYSESADNFDKLAMIDEELRQKNTRTLLDQRDKLTDQLVTQFEVNQWGPYQDKRKAAAELAKLSNADKWAGINTLASGKIYSNAGNIGDKGGMTPEMQQLISLLKGSSLLKNNHGGGQQEYVPGYGTDFDTFF